MPPPGRLAARAPAGERPRELLDARSCYVCKTEYRRLHPFYDALCPACAELNYEKRFQTADLHGRVALVTGARVKIGYQAALNLLRADATVVATTRFPHDAARRYAAEPDFAEWSARLRVHGLDLRHSPSVEIFCRQVSRELGRLDLLVNNACQTVRRPPGFYEHLLDGEEWSTSRRWRASSPAGRRPTATPTRTWPRRRSTCTLTSAREYVRDGIHMNAVDTGWITDEDPFVHAARKREDLGFQPPLDIVDGAARVLDPFLSGLNTGQHPHGKFFKEYVPSSW